MRNKANKQTQIEAGRACLIATSWAMYNAREAAGLAVTDDDNVTGLLAEIEAATESFWERRRLADPSVTAANPPLPPDSPASNGIVKMPGGEDPGDSDYLRSA
jgi:hypothetical protein